MEDDEENEVAPKDDVLLDYSESREVPTRECPCFSDKETDKDKWAAYDAWKNRDYLCRNYILNGLDNTLYNVYSQDKASKDLWKSLEKKYRTEDAGMKKFIVGKFLNYKMIDFKSVLSQVQELQLLLHDFHADGMQINEPFQVSLVVEP
ncbi:uncharacterized protein [Henckelia pumila]|uniref:uncharacterized protein n=1 Tax=Henckelia pumila TaxID=405737 RepID=UPI003C6E96AB